MAKSLESHYAITGQLYKAYEKGGRDSIKIKNEAAQKAVVGLMTPEPEHRMKKAITDKTSDQLKFSFALWIRVAVQDLIKQIFSINMPIRTVGEYLSRWGFTPQKPLRRAYEQNSKMVQKWLDEQYPAITARAKQQKAEIQWGDQT